jgi:hypothetical protein
VLLALVIGGILLFIGAGVAIAIWCLSGVQPEQVQADNDQDAERDATPASQPVVPPRPAPAEEKPFIVLPQADQERVNAAVTRGVAYLKTSQRADGTWLGNRVGCTAFPALTLLECGVAREDPVIQRAARHLRADATWKSLNTTYDIALTILFFDRFDEAADRERIRTLAFRLVAGQTATGGWTYTCPVLPEAEQSRLAAVLESTASTASGKLEASPLALSKVDYSKLGPAAPFAQVKKLAVLQEPRQRPDRKLAGPPGDNSNTQLAILALWAARRHGVPLERTIAWVVKRFRTSQQADGHWGYHYPGPGLVKPTHSMTCAGLLGLAIGLGLTNEAKSKSGKQAEDATRDPDVARAIKLLSSQVGNPSRRWQGHPHPDLYFLWSIERVAVIFKLPRIGDKDWYPWGAELIVANQARDGSLVYHNRPVGTALALLFLKRANLAKGLEKLVLGD